jgi:site-specific recombinase XerC
VRTWVHHPRDPAAEVDCGLRRSEVSGLRVGVFGVKAAAELDRYMRSRESAMHEDAALFIGQYGGLTSNAIYQLIEKTRAWSRPRPVGGCL